MKKGKRDKTVFSGAEEISLNLLRDSLLKFDKQQNQAKLNAEHNRLTETITELTGLTKEEWLEVLKNRLIRRVN